MSRGRPPRKWQLRRFDARIKGIAVRYAMKSYEVLLVPGGSALFQRVFMRLGCNGRPPRFRVEFYPYSSLVLTIRRREGAMYVRFSDLLQRAPLPVLEGGAALLLSRVYRRKAPRHVVEPTWNMRARIRRAIVSAGCEVGACECDKAIHGAATSIFPDYSMS